MSENVFHLEAEKAKQQARGKNCPTCGQPADLKFRPFCSSRCAQLDLGRWLNEDYRVPVVEYDEMSDYDEGEEE